MATLLDSVLQYLVPPTDKSSSNYKLLKKLMFLMPLSSSCADLVEEFLSLTEDNNPPKAADLQVNVDRMLASERRFAQNQSESGSKPKAQRQGGRGETVPSQPVRESNNKGPLVSQEDLINDTVFCQLFLALSMSEKKDRPLTYRWSLTHKQWWTVDFIGEGIVDQGGGFRDILSEIAEELTPGQTCVRFTLPFFIPTPNQLTSGGDGQLHKDLMYVPNPQCRLFNYYKWIGQLMGACLRSSENLVLLLPSFFWKKLLGKTCTWSQDYCTVDEHEVEIIDKLSTMSADGFEMYFGDERTWTTTLCDGTTRQLRNDGDKTHVTYEERDEYARLVRDVRMNESNAQIDAIREGFASVVPDVIFDLLTWRNVQRRVCGDDNITFEALRQCVEFRDNNDPPEPIVEHLYDALRTFTSDERSHFLRFVTGRKRLPAQVKVTVNYEDGDSHLPTSSTCSSLLQLPFYTSAEICASKLRYAIFNCIEIDNDCH